MSVHEQIMERTRLARMRMGQQVGEPVEIPSMPEVRAMLVPLTEAEVVSGFMHAANIDVQDNTAGLGLRDRAARTSDVFHALRESNDLTQKVFHSIEEMSEALEPDDIDIIAQQLVVLMQSSSASLADMTDEEVANLKKVWETIELRGLTGRPAAALLLLLSAITPDLLRAKSPSSTSTP